MRTLKGPVALFSKNAVITWLSETVNGFQWYGKICRIKICYSCLRRRKRKNRKLGALASKRVAAAAHLPTPWLFEPTKRPDDRADYCLDYVILYK